MTQTTVHQTAARNHNSKRSEWFNHFLGAYFSFHHYTCRENEIKLFFTESLSTAMAGRIQHAYRRYGDAATITDLSDCHRANFWLVRVI